MRNKLKLKGTALQLYAIIYGFSYDGESECSGSLAYLSETAGCTKQTVLNGLNKLESAGYILKRQTRDSDGGLRNHYRINASALDEEYDFPQPVENDCGKLVESKTDRSKNFTHAVKKSQSPQSKNNNTPSQKSRHNNTIREYIGYERERASSHASKKMFGEFANVCLTSEEYNTLQGIYGDLFPTTLSSLSTYMASTGRKYPNHYATLFRWCMQDKDKQKRKPKPETLPESPTVNVSMSESEKHKYDQLKKDMVISLGDSEIDAMNAASLSNKLLQIANGAIYDENKSAIPIHDRKLDALEDIIKAANGKPSLTVLQRVHRSTLLNL